MTRICRSGSRKFGSCGKFVNTVITRATVVGVAVVLAVSAGAALLFARPSGPPAIPAKRLANGQPEQVVGGDPNVKEIALTFDDGPVLETTPRLLENLRQEGARATFFLVGTQVERYPELAKRIVEEGHEVGNHTYSHPRLPGLSPRRQREEWVRGEEAIRKATGVPTLASRPPGGRADAATRAVAKRLGATLAFWTCVPGDVGTHDSERLIHIVAPELRPGTVILLHEGVPATLEALPRLIREAKRRGLRFVTVSEMGRQAGLTQAKQPELRATAEAPVAR